MATSAAEMPAWPDDVVEVGRIADAWGVKGWIKVQPFSNDPQALLNAGVWFLRSPAETGHRPSPDPSSAASRLLPTSLTVGSARRHGDMVVACVEEIVDRSAAEALKGVRVFVSRGSFPKANPDEFYWVDLIGLEVVNRQGQRLGTVTDLIDTGPHAVLRIRPIEAAEGDDAERLVPFVASYVDDVSLADRRITVDWGLDY
ncbi:MAG TPA: ribosome maturation factor RimM [Burkholderiaceae bacterium]|nr:ribosome maturation factor RimM [Burkholderiaceae bacterium]